VPTLAACGDGVLDVGSEQCDDGNTVNGDCCSSACQFEPSGSACGNETSTTCNAPDTCDGSGICLANNSATTVECRAAAGDCDVAEYCDGQGSCPVDSFKSSGTACGDQTATTRNNPDTCDGSGTCHANNSATTVECRAAARDCDVAEYCDGQGSCPVDSFKSRGTACDDQTATTCNNPDTCDGSGTCLANNSATTVECRAAAGECDVAEYCDGAGSCPADSFEPSGTACGDPSDTVCNNPDTCDGAGNCLANNEPNTLECRASAGECDVAENCDGAGSCPPDAFEPSTTPCTADDNVCTDDHCDGAGVCVHPPNTDPCDDGDQCTVNDRCSNAVCAGEDVIVKPACRWVMMGGYGGNNPKRPKQVGGRIRENATVTGDICGDTVRVGGNSIVAGQVVATRNDCSGNAGVELGPNANVEDVDNVIVTGGSTVIGKPLGTQLPGCFDPPRTAIGCNEHVVPPCPPPAYYDTTGNDDLVTECNDSRQTLAGYVTDLNSAVCTAEIDPSCGRIPAGETLFIGPGGISLTDGGTGKDCLKSGSIQQGQLNYVCLGTTLLAATDSNIEIDDNGDTATEYVLIVSGATKLLLRSKITLDMPLDASRVLIYGKTKCYIGDGVRGAGTLVCPKSKLQVWTRVEWKGALLSGNGYVQVGDNSIVTHVPLLFSGQ